MASLGSVAGLHDVTVPPSDPSARALRDLFPDYTEDRKIWHLPGTAPTVGVCSLVPVSRLRKEDARMFLAVVVFQGGNVWIPTMEFSEVPLHVANPCQQFAIRQQPLKQPVTSIQQQQQQPLPQIEPIQAQQSQQSQQQQPEFLSPPGCMKRVEQLLLSPQSATFSAVQTWPCVKALLEACSQKTGKGELEELTVLKTSPTKVIRVVFSGKFRLKVQTIHTLEEKVTISLPQSSVRISCTELAGTSVCAECYTPSDSGSWLETS